MYGINSDTTEGTRSSLRRNWKYWVPETSFLSFSVQERAGEINRRISTTASDWMQYSHLVNMTEEGAVIIYHLSEGHLPWRGRGEDSGQAKVPCILSVLTPTSKEHLQGATRTPARLLQGRETCTLCRIRQSGHAKGLVPCSWPSTPAAKKDIC